MSGAARTRAETRLRRLWLNVHLAIGLGMALLLMPISLSGALLVWHDELDALINPRLYAVTQGAPQTALVLLASARTALGSEFEPLVLRLPANGGPALVTAREARRSQGERPRVVTVHLDPATAKVLGVVEFRNSLFGVLHRFHENLTIPEYSGRAIVGWTGVAMLVMSLSGIYLWWPRKAGLLTGLRWRRGLDTSYNLHHLFGFWISVPLAVVSATGIYLGFPQQGRDLLSAIAPMTPPQRGGFAAPLLASPRLDVDRVAELALGNAVKATARVGAIFLPTQQAQIWRVQLQASDGEATMLIDDRSAAVSGSAPRPGDNIAQWIRWIHEGSHSGLAWRVIVSICGILPTGFVVTGAMIWLRSRRTRTTARARMAAVPEIGPAE